MRDLTYCDVFWGSHGCSLPPGHDGDVHQCGSEASSYGVCSQMRKTDDQGGGQVRFWHTNDPPRWSEWSASDSGWSWFTNHGEVR